MKRILSLFIALAMLLSFTSAFAAEDDVAARFEQAMLTQYNSGAIKMNIGIDVDGSVFNQDEDLTMIKEVINGLDIVYDLNVLGNADNTKIEASGDISIISDMLIESLTGMPGDTSMDFDVWLDMDVSDIENPVYYMIMKDPFNNDYMIVDVAGDVFTESLMQAQNTGLFNSEQALEFNKKVYSGIDTNVKFADGKYTLTMTDAEFKTAIAKFITNLIDAMAELGIPQDEIGEIKSELTEAMLPFASLQLFDKDEAFILTCEVDENNLCTGISFKLNLDANIYDLGVIFTPEDFEGEFRDDWNIKCRLSMDMKYGKLPENFSVEYPVLTPDNGVNFIDFYNAGTFEYDVDWATPLTVNYNGSEIAFDEPPVLLRNRTMVPIRALANAIGISDENISYDEATERIVLKNETTEIVMYVNSKYAYLNGELKFFDVPAVENNGRTYIPARAISEFFGKNVDYTDLAYSGGFGLIVDITD